MAALARYIGTNIGIFLRYTVFARLIRHAMDSQKKRLKLVAVNSVTDVVSG